MTPHYEVELTYSTTEASHILVTGEVYTRCGEGYWDGWRSPGPHFELVTELEAARRQIISLPEAMALDLLGHEVCGASGTELLARAAEVVDMDALEQAEAQDHDRRFAA